MKYKRICKICGIVYYAQKKKSKFCSKKCLGEYKHLKNLQKLPKLKKQGGDENIEEHRYLLGSFVDIIKKIRRQRGLEK